jgi:hypothetical protein
VTREIALPRYEVEWQEQEQEQDILNYAIERVGAKGFIRA